MPLGKNVRYRMKGDVRLAFKDGEVVEAKNVKTGKEHTPEEFKEEKDDEHNEVRHSSDYKGLMDKLKEKGPRKRSKV